MEYKVSEVVKIISGGTPKRKNSEYWNGEIPWLSVKDFNNKNRLVHETEEQITEAGLNNSAATLVSKGTVVISARGTVGELCQVAKSMTFNQSCFGLEAISKYTTNEYIYYWFKYKTNYIKSNTHGSVFDTINRKTFENLYIYLPNISYQKQVVNILKTLDNKIEINQNIIANLEELSQTLFKRWFVDFEFPDENGNPYKSSGGEMIDSELGEIPDGWNVKNLKDIAFCQNGYAFYKLGYSNSGYFAVDLGNININSQFVYTNKDKFISKDIIDEKKEKFILNKNDLVMVMTDRTQEMNILGRTARIPKSNKYVLNQRIFRLRAKNKHILTYLQAMLNSVEIRNQLKMKSLGSAQKYINTKHITELSIKCPDNELIKNFYRSCENYFIKSEMLNEEIEKLTQLRDTLLPKLMSGEIEIPDDIEVNEDELSI
ncbi:restriction endonuclease subunit S [Staphylococcus succinus]